MPDNIRFAVAGYGDRGRSLLDLAVRSFPDVVPVGVCDLDEQRLRIASADHPGASLFTDFRTMLHKTEVNAVLIATPATFHARLCCEALHRGIYVLSEVPAVADFQEAGELWEAQQASKAFYMLGANPNMWGFVEKAVELLREGCLGSPYYMEAEYIHDIRSLFDLTPWRETYESIRYCTHSLGPLLRLIDEDLEWVASFGTGSHINLRSDQHDAMVAIFRTPSNVVVRLLTSFINNYPGCTHGYRVYATKGYFERKPECEGAGPARTLFCSTKGGAEKKLIELPTGELHPEFEHAAASGGHGGADYIILYRFFDAIRHGLPSPISLREALRMTLPGVFAAQSARDGGTLTRIEYPWSATS
jgi:predicted dehydrogenase